MADGYQQSQRVIPILCCLYQPRNLAKRDLHGLLDIADYQMSHLSGNIGAAACEATLELPGGLHATTKYGPVQGVLRFCDWPTLEVESNLYTRYLSLL